MTHEFYVSFCPKSSLTHPLRAMATEAAHLRMGCPQIQAEGGTKQQGFASLAWALRKKLKKSKKSDVQSRRRRLGAESLKSTPGLASAH